MGFLEVLTLVLIVLKVLNLGHYSWLVALAPIIGAFSLYLVLFLVALTFGTVRIRRGK